MYKTDLSVNLNNSILYVSNEYDALNMATTLLKPVDSGIQILRNGLYLVLCRYVLSTNTANERLIYGIRNFKTANNYIDSTDSVSSSTTRTNLYYYIRFGHFDMNTYLRPIVSAATGGTCVSCTLTVVSLKSE